MQILQASVEITGQEAAEVLANCTLDDIEETYGIPCSEAERDLLVDFIVFAAVQWAHEAQLVKLGHAHLVERKRKAYDPVSGLAV